MGKRVRCIAKRRGARLLDIVVLVVVLLLPSIANALHRVDPGETPSLKDGEGLLAISVDTSEALASVKFLKAGAFFSGDVLSRVPAGRTMQLYVVPAGRYQWNKVNLFDTFGWSSILTLKDDPEYGFEVQAGRITFPGELVVRPQGLWRARVWIANRSLPVVDWLRGKFPQTYARYPFAYSGHYPDPFPEFYRKELAAVDTPPADLDTRREPPAAGELPLSPKLLWTPGRIQAASLNPGGTLVAEIVREGDVWWLELVDVAVGTSQRVVKSALGIEYVRWKGERTLLVGLPAAGGTQLHAFLIGERSGEALGIQHLKGPTGGRIVDLLPASPNDILYEGSMRLGLAVHRLDVSSQKGIEGFPWMSWTGRLNRGVKDDYAWYADGSGRLRMAWSKKDGASVLVYGADGQYREVLRSTDDTGLELLLLSYEGDVVYALSDEERLQRDLVAYDPVQAKVTATLFSKAGVDVVDAIFDDRRRPIGVKYYQGGNLVSEYFDGRNRDVGAELQAAFPKRSVSVVERSRGTDRMLLWVDGSDQPEQLYYFDATRREAQLIDESRPQLGKRTFVPSALLKVQGKDGLPVEAFVTLPDGAGKRPLVVMPHGGPIGISDAMHFNRDVQFLASLGYAVLQVNFRGSDGYGRAFREAGRRQLGQGIEDDIDAALQAALKQFPLDEDRMCMLGASYGGYSALFSAIRWPGRFRCAVSIAGVSDRVLMFTASDSASGKAGRKALETLIGDPNAELERLIDTSPLYRYRQLTTPVMLVHGDEDRRVDPEHTRRLARLLNLAGRPPVVLTFEKEGHGFTEPKDLEAQWSGVAGFLRKHLDAPRGAGAGATAGAK